MDSQKFVKLDAGEGIFFARELEFIKSKSYDIKYAELKARQLIPVSYEAGPGAESITYSQYDHVGMAKLISNYANDLPRADVRGKQYTARVHSLGASYGYSLQEIRAAKLVGKPLEQRRANAAKRAVLQLENKIAFFGESEHGIQGLLNHANITILSLPADGSINGGTNSTQIKYKTPDQVLRDMNLAANAAFNTTFGIEMPDTLLLPLTMFSYISTVARSPNSDTTILEYFKKNSPFIKNVDFLLELTGTGVGGSDSMLAYRRDPDALTLEIPQDFEQLPVQEDGLEFKINCHSRLAGVLVYYPLSIVRVDGV